jgi:peptidoglycan/LPS O-acetylase OafA/YrhL
MPDSGTRAEWPLLNAARWVSASIVLLGHATLLILHPAASLHDGIAASVLTFFARSRFSAVTIFFVLSGFLVGGGVLRAGDRFRWPIYCANRFARIYIVLIPALLLTAALDGLAYLMNPSSPIYSSPWPSGVMGSEPPFSHYGVANVLVSIFSVEPLSQPLGSNTALWSLGYEWVFYFLLPLLFQAGRSLRLGTWFGYSAMLLGPLLLLPFGKAEAAAYWFIWCAGAVARVFVGNTPWHRAASRTGGVAFLLTLLAMAAAGHKPWSELALGVSFALLIANEQVLGLRLNARLDKVLADCSYSLYVTHMPCAAFITFLFWSANLLPPSGVPFGASFLTMWAAIIAAALAIAFAFERLFERNTAALRDAIANVTFRRRKTPPELLGATVIETKATRSSTTL